mmetsp:Transcript_218/g.300  ORF Transcript_218/g.300 Transcript_218/m.300 type:complete len:103 (+) Transcript_218:884-1192(+)
MIQKLQHKHDPLKSISPAQRKEAPIFKAIQIAFRVARTRKFSFRQRHCLEFLKCAGHAYKHGRLPLKTVLCAAVALLVERVGVATKEVFPDFNHLKFMFRQY